MPPGSRHDRRGGRDSGPPEGQAKETGAIPGGGGALLGAYMEARRCVRSLHRRGHP
jgi:hypothetical protein